MTKISVWKRVGGWLRRSQETPSQAEVVRLDADGMLTDSQADQDEAPQRSLMTGKKDRQMAAMEEGFGRLVEVLESINDNVVQQRQQAAEQRHQLAGLGDLARTMPEVIAANQQASKELSEHLRNQSMRNQQLAELVKELPSMTQAQVEKLAQINQQLESSAEADLRMAESFNRLDGSMGTVVNSSKAQATSLDNVGKLLERNDQRLEELLSKQRRRFVWLFVLVLTVSLAAIGAVIAVVALLLHSLEAI